MINYQIWIETKNVELQFKFNLKSGMIFKICKFELICEKKWIVNLAQKPKFWNIFIPWALNINKVPRTGSECLIFTQNRLVSF
jgi:hypothetical protein